MPKVENSIFYNSDYIVIEYMDLIKMPFFVLLTLLSKNQKIKEILKIEDIEGYSENGLLEWYVNRKNQNFFIDLVRDPRNINKETLDKLLDDQISSSIHFYDTIGLLPLGKTLKIMKDKNVAKDILIYYPYHNDYAKKDLDKFLNEKFTFMDNFEDIVDKAGENSTYFLSNIELLDIIIKKDKLNFSSINLPIEYRYNKKSDLINMKYDFDDMLRKYCFKLAYIKACSK